MSIINSDQYNVDFQLKVLKGLQAATDLLKTVVNNSINPSTVTSKNKTTAILRPTTTGTVLAGKNSVSIANVGTANGTVKGVTLKPGETVSFSGGALNNTLDAIAYVATGTEFLIITVG